MMLPFSARTCADQANCCQRERIGDIELKEGALDFGKSARLVCQQTCGLTQNEIGGKSKKSECQQENSEG
jgi:hypothetical protein